MNAVASHAFEIVALDRPPKVTPQGRCILYGQDEKIFREGDACRYVYRVISGAVRSWQMLSNGWRQVVEFDTAGDIFGLDGEVHHALSAETMSETILYVVRRDVFLNEQGSEAAIHALLKKFHRAQAHILLLGRGTACERVAAFLLDFRDRTGCDAIELLMSHQDIADYLGLTIETVSCTFAQLQASGLIDLASGYRVILRDPMALERICE